MRAKLEQMGITMLGAAMKEKPENHGEMIYRKLRQPPFSCKHWTWTMDLFVINLTQNFISIFTLLYFADDNP